MIFRNDINGLRAIAVIAVSIFHFFPSIVPGGFAGVDIFFVVSGFLMTNIIFKGLNNNNFSLVEFYTSRANRIVPALSVMCFVLLLFGWFFLPPYEYQILGQHSASSLSFLSNIVYWREAGYFDSSSYEKWLLHTWSLSVEWQFYIIYPLVILAIKSIFSLESVKKFLLYGTVLAFIASAYITLYRPSASYFLLPTRAWEMAIGGLVYFYPLSVKESKSKFIGYVGLLLIFLSFFSISKNTAWPGYMALMPTIGACLVILSNDQRNLITNNFTFQNIGKWSYSIYLWHWPVLVGLLYLELTDYLHVGLIVSVFLGWLSYQTVEKIKFKKIYDRASIIKSVPIWMVLFLGSASVFIWISQGYIPHYPRVVANISKAADDMPDYYRYCFEESPNEYCVLHTLKKYDRTIKQDVKAIVIGDSHASSVALSVMESMNRVIGSGDIIFYGYPGCLTVPVGDVINRPGRSVNCTNLSNNILKIAKQYPNVNIYISQRYAVYFFGDSTDFHDDNQTLTHIHNVSLNDFDVNSNAQLLSKKYQEFLVELNEINNNIYILSPIPEQGFNVPRYVSKNLLIHGDLYLGIPTHEYKERNDFVYGMLNQIEEDNIADIISISNALCHSGNCSAVVNNRSLYYDKHHLSKYGASYLSSLFDVTWAE